MPAFMYSNADLAPILAELDKPAKMEAESRAHAIEMLNSAAGAFLARRAWRSHAGRGPPLHRQARDFQRVRASAERLLNALALRPGGRIGTMPDHLHPVLTAGHAIAGMDPAATVAGIGAIVRDAALLERRTRLAIDRAKRGPAGAHARHAGDVDLGAFVADLAVAWLAARERWPGYSRPPGGGTPYGPFIRFVLAALAPLGERPAAKTIAAKLDALIRPTRTMRQSDSSARRF